MTDRHKANNANGTDSGALRFLAASNLEAGGIQHGFFLRSGGVSTGLYASLNCGRGSKDVRAHVEENRVRAALTLGVTSEKLIGPRQVHSHKAVIAVNAWQPNGAPDADAAVTNEPGLAVCVLTADCAPILMADAPAGVVAAVHAGWKGAKAGVVESTIEAMEGLGARASRISAAIGPAISAAAYEVSPEFKSAFLMDDEANEQYFEQRPGSRPHFNLPAFVKHRLLRSGVTNIEDVGVCTYENESILFSFRRTCHRFEPDYGRQISAILIR
jgi:polyphenol oxidase